MDEFEADFAQAAWVSSIATGGLSIAGDTKTKQDNFTFELCGLHCHALLSN